MQTVQALTTVEVVERFIESADGSFTPSEVAKRTGQNAVSVRGHIRRMVDRGDLVQEGYGRYRRASSGDGSDGASVEAPASLSPARTSVPDTAPDAADLVTYPYAPHGHAGNWEGRSNTGMEGHEVITLHRAFLLARLGRVPDTNTTYWTHLVGSSMMPWLRDGALIGIEITREIRADDRYALYLDDAEEEIVKRVCRLGGKRLRLSADNPAYGTQEIEHVEDDLYRDAARGHTLRLRVLGRVIEPPDDAQSIFATAIAAVRGLSS